jgi:hypothetical protein
MINLTSTAFSSHSPLPSSDPSSEAEPSFDDDDEADDDDEEEEDDDGVGERRRRFLPLFDLLLPRFDFDFDEL